MQISTYAVSCTFSTTSHPLAKSQRGLRRGGGGLHCAGLSSSSFTLFASHPINPNTLPMHKSMCMYTSPNRFCMSLHQLTSVEVIRGSDLIDDRYIGLTAVLRALLTSWAGSGHFRQSVNVSKREGPFFVRNRKTAKGRRRRRGTRQGL